MFCAFFAFFITADGKDIVIIIIINNNIQFCTLYYSTIVMSIKCLLFKPKRLKVSHDLI